MPDRRVSTTLTVCLLTLACSGSTGPETARLNLRVVSGDGQVGWEGTVLAQPIVVEVVDRDGAPVVGDPLRVATSNGSGEILDVSTVTDEQGRFQFRWELGENFENTATVSSAAETPAQTTVHATARYAYAVPEVVSDGWQTASLESVGMDSELLAELIDSVRSGHYPEVHSVVIVKDGQLVLDEYFPGHDFGYTNPPSFLGTYLGFDRTTRHNTHSATKSVVSALVGLAMDQGLIANEEETMFSFFDDYQSLNVDGKDQITIRDLLTMTSGLEWHEWDAPVGGGQNSIDVFNRSADPIGYVLGQPLLHEPGSVFNYNGGTVNILCQIVARASGVEIDRFARDYLFGPMGVTNYSFPHLPSGIVVCHGDIYITPRDMAKFGTMYLNRGQWDGHRILSEDWVQRSVAPSVSLADLHLSWADDYGYLWWRKAYSVGGRTYPSFKALGWGGQEIEIFPEEDLVVVFTGANYAQNPPCDEILTRFVLPSLRVVAAARDRAR